MVCDSQDTNLLPCSFTCQAPLIFFEVDASDNSILAVNDRFVEWLGYTSSSDVVGLNFFDRFLNQKDHEQFKSLMRASSNGGAATSATEGSLIHKDGSLRYFEWNTKFVRDSSIHGSSLLVYGVNISDKITTLCQLNDSKEMFNLIFDKAPIGMGSLNANFIFTQVNTRLSEILGYIPDQLKGESLLSCFVREDRFSVQKDIFQPFKLGSMMTYQSDCQWVTSERGMIWVNICIVAVPKGKFDGMFMVMVTDIGEKKRTLEEVERLAFYDSLTSLPNRRLIEDRIDYSIQMAIPEKKRIGILFIDMDHFKGINDSFGHIIGDQFLVEVAKRLEGTLRSSDTVGRMGGDEFVALLDGLKAPTDAALVAIKIIYALTIPYHVEGNRILSTPSIGISIFPEDGTDRATLMQKADAAMYQAKEREDVQFQFYSHIIEDSYPS